VLPARASRDWRGALVFVLTLAAFLPCLWNGFLDFDDPMYVVRQPQVLSGLSVETLGWAFRGGGPPLYHPLTMLSHALDVSLFGDAAWGHHATSLLLHALNGWLVFLLLGRVVSPKRALLGALLFALHPMRAESVAWISERKDVLSGTFGLLALLAYLEGPEQLRWRLATSAAMALGLLAKPSLVTLPCVLLLLDFWLLQRWSGGWRSALALVAEKLPMFALAASFAVLTWMAHSSAGSIHEASVSDRLVRCLWAYGAAQRLTLAPFGIVGYIPAWSPVLRELDVGLGLFVLVLLPAFAWTRRRDQPWLLATSLIYLGMMFPVSGVVGIGSHAYAVRYTYLPSVALSLAIAHAAPSWLFRSRAALVGIVVAGALLGLASARQCRHWRASVPFWRECLDAHPDCNPVALAGLGGALVSAGRPTEALEPLELSLVLAPRWKPLLKKSAEALIACGKLRAAEARLQRLLRLDRLNLYGYENLAAVQLRLGRPLDAARNLRLGLIAVPGQLRLRGNLCYALKLLGKPEEAAAIVVEIADELRLSNSMIRSGRAALSNGEAARALEELSQGVTKEEKFQAAMRIGFKPASGR